MSTTRMLRQRGFSMIEALVTVLIFGLGLLSVAGLHSVSKRSLHESVQRTTAAQLSQALFERMRANPAALSSYVAAGELDGDPVPAAPTNCTAPATPCAAGTVAARDLAEWERELIGASSALDGTATGGLVNPTACIRGPADGSAGVYTLVIAWQGSAELSNQSADNCGSGNYGPGDENRRIATFSTYIDPQT